MKKFNEFLRTKRQKEVYKELLDDNAISEETATQVRGINYDIAVNLVHKGIFNCKYVVNIGYAFWIRSNDEEKTILWYVNLLYYKSGNNNEILIDNEKRTFVLLKYDSIYSTKIIFPEIYKLAKKLGIKRNYDIMLEGSDILYWNITKRQAKFEFDGNVFIRVQ